MGAKVQRINGAYTLVIHYQHRRTHQRFGKLERDGRYAEKEAARINGQIAAGVFEWPKPEPKRDSFACDAVLDRYLESHRPTLRESTYESYSSLAETHLKPHFGSRDIRTLGRNDLLGFIRAKKAEGAATSTIRNALAVLRQACSALVEDGRLERNPLSGAGKLIGKVGNQDAAEDDEVQAWSREEAQAVLRVLEKHEPSLPPLIDFLLGTGCRLGEALALRWERVDLGAGTARIIQSARNGRVTKGKKGRARKIQLPPGLVSRLRVREAEAKLAGDASGWVFPSERGTVLNTGNVSRVWQRAKRHLVKSKLPALRIHDCRHHADSWIMPRPSPVVRL
jgi:integrase